jgi:hypothetical protein
MVAPLRVLTPRGHMQQWAAVHMINIALLIAKKKDQLKYMCSINCF